MLNYHYRRAPISISPAGQLTLTYIHVAQSENLYPDIYKGFHDSFVNYMNSHFSHYKLEFFRGAWYSEATITNTSNQKFCHLYITDPRETNINTYNLKILKLAKRLKREDEIRLLNTNPFSIAIDQSNQSFLQNLQIIHLVKHFKDAKKIRKAEKQSCSIKDLAQTLEDFIGGQSPQKGA